MTDDVDVINDAIASDPAPRMSKALSNTVELFRGVQQKTDDGEVVWHTLAEVRELTGADEEALAKLEDKKDITYTEYMNALLARAVVRIGSLEVPAYGEGLMNKLILGDRSLLFLAILRCTYGLTKEVRVTCPYCDTVNDIEINLDDDFPIVRPSIDVRQPIEVTTKDGTFKLRLPNGLDTVEVQKQGKTDAEINTAMLARCVVWEEGTQPPDIHDWAVNLSLGTRRKLIEALAAVKLGPDLDSGVDTHCAACGKDMPLILDWASLLLS